MSRALVVYYSRTGTTRQLATQLASALGADLEEIVDHRQRAGLLGYVRSGFDATYRRLTPIEPTRRDLKLYDVVVIGSPTWNSAVSSPVRTYLMANRDRLRRVALFSTCNMRGSQHVLRQMSELSGKPPIASLTLRSAEVEGGANTSEFTQFVQTIRGSLPPPGVALAQPVLGRPSAPASPA